MVIRVIQRIFVALDDSPRAAGVAARGMEFARATGAAVRVYHAVSVPPEFPPAAATHGGDPLPAYLHRIATERLHALVDEVRDVPCEVLVEQSSSAWRSILDAASHFDADVIVIGSHGYDMLERVLGTTAAKVVDLSTRDVFVVRRFDVGEQASTSQ